MSYTSRSTPELRDLRYKMNEVRNQMGKLRKKYLDLDVKLSAMKFERERLQNESRKNC